MEEYGHSPEEALLWSRHCPSPVQCGEQQGAVLDQVLRAVEPLPELRSQRLILDDGEVGRPQAPIRVDRFFTLKISAMICPAESALTPANDPGSEPRRNSYDVIPAWILESTAMRSRRVDSRSARIDSRRRASALASPRSSHQASIPKARRIDTRITTPRRRYDGFVCYWTRDPPAPISDRSAVVSR